MKRRWQVILACICLVVAVALGAALIAIPHLTREMSVVKTSSTSTDLDALTREIHLPPGSQSTVWFWRIVPKGGLVPSPSEHLIIARVNLTPDEMGELLAQGEWVVAALPADEFGGVAPATASVLMNTSRQPKHSVIDGTAWMNVTLYADKDANALYLSVVKD